MLVEFSLQDWGKIQRRMQISVCSRELTRAQWLRYFPATTTTTTTVTSNISKTFWSFNPLLWRYPKGKHCELCGHQEISRESSVDFEKGPFLDFSKTRGVKCFEMKASEFLHLFIFLPIAAAMSIPEQGKFYQNGWFLSSQICIHLERPWFVLPF